MENDKKLNVGYGWHGEPSKLTPDEERWLAERLADNFKPLVKWLENAARKVREQIKPTVEAQAGKWPSWPPITNTGRYSAKTANTCAAPSGVVTEFFYDAKGRLMHHTYSERSRTISRLEPSVKSKDLERLAFDDERADYIFGQLYHTLLAGMDNCATIQPYSGLVVSTSEYQADHAVGNTIRVRYLSDLRRAVQLHISQPGRLVIVKAYREFFQTL